jgi:hypothetical protein
LIRNEGVQNSTGFDLPYRGGNHFSVGRFNITLMKIYPRVNMPRGSKYHMTPLISK